MRSYLAIVLTDNNKSVHDVLRPFGIKQKIEKYVEKTKSEVIFKEKQNLNKAISEYYKILDQQTLKEEQKNRMIGAYNFLNKIYNSSDEEIFKFAIRNLDKSMIDKDGNVYSRFNKYARWFNYSIDSEYTNILPVQIDSKEGVIFTNQVKLKDILWDKLKYKALFADAIVRPEGLWLDEETHYYLKAIRNKNGEISFKEGIIDKACKMPNNQEWTVNVVEYYI